MSRVCVAVLMCVCEGLVNVQGLCSCADVCVCPL